MMKKEGGPLHLALPEISSIFVPDIFFLIWPLHIYLQVSKTEYDIYDFSMCRKT